MNTKKLDSIKTELETLLLKKKEIGQQIWNLLDTVDESDLDGVDSMYVRVLKRDAERDTEAPHEFKFKWIKNTSFDIIPREEKWISLQRVGSDATEYGVMIGDAPIGVMFTFPPDSDIMFVTPKSNPVILTLNGDVVYGVECWWKEVDLRDIVESENGITNSEIDDTIQFMNLMVGGGRAPRPTRDIATWSRDEVATTVWEIVTQLLVDDNHDFTDNDPLVDLGMDSLSLVEGTLALEEAFEVDIDDTMLEGVSTTNDIIEMIMVLVRRAQKGSK